MQTKWQCALAIAVTLATMMVGCNRQPPRPSSLGKSRSPNTPAVDLSAERRGFVTQLRRRGPAPQPYEAATPPAHVEEVRYPSSGRQLKAWLSKDPGDGKKRPAVVYLHGGWAFAPVDWQDAQPFVDAGFVVMMPMLRAENGNPGDYEGFYGEVDDAISAGEFVRKLPYVDPDNVFLAGHSVGAVLATLTAMMPSRYKAAAALSGYLEMESWAANEHPSRVIFDPTNRQEVRLRNPMAFAASLRIPLILYAERGGMDEINAAFVALAKRAGKTCRLVVTDGDHSSMVAPAVRHAIGWYREQTK